MPNFLTSLFNTTVYESSNFYNPLSYSLISDISFDNPYATSSPNRATRPAQDSIHQSATPRHDIQLKVLVVNCQSIRGANRKPLFHNMIDSTQPDIVIGCESCLDNSISSAEVFPPQRRPQRWQSWRSFYFGFRQSNRNSKSTLDVNCNRFML